jgi:hypothetical protein
MPPRQAIQRSVHERHHRVVTGANLFARSVGSAIGIAVFGAIVSSPVESGGDAQPDPAEPAAERDRVGDP